MMRCWVLWVLALFVFAAAGCECKEQPAASTKTTHVDAGQARGVKFKVAANQIVQGFTYKDVHGADHKMIAPYEGRYLNATLEIGSASNKEMEKHSSRVLAVVDQNGDEITDAVLVGTGRFPVYADELADDATPVIGTDGKTLGRSIFKKNKEASSLEWEVAPGATGWTETLVFQLPPDVEKATLVFVGEGP